MSWVFWLYAVPAVTFGVCVAAYARRRPWRARRTARVAFTILGLDAALFVVLALAATFRFAHLPHTVAVALAVGAMTFVQLAGLAHLALILRPPGRDRSPH